MPTDMSGLPRLVLRESNPLLTLFRALKVVRRDSGALLRSVASSLAAEGRRFGVTPEGVRLKEQLQQSELLARARLLWQALDGDALLDSGAQPAGDILAAHCDLILSSHLEVLFDEPEADRDGA